ncbi:RagB/SusD family nutrient uptake outer membrane protein [Spirosoma sp. KUDC1026]|uniref:RagB/SusD family nutrient uptake outer membrane protein n=1 Tax=Spirosoma sp. KUDC1026 TaxID=2745947 RepID=UPI00159BD955|nr:RagB/SusD family nutrient uptake outer membrane protein [Spirosoma sp. KUDC1026]QKZ12484.1 RagB/SusD family nutrient uptake outer membrane protein [Spirosoma sp. KUDC1026]
MKTLQKLLTYTCVSGLIAAGGCSTSFLDVPPQGQQTPTDFFSSNADAATSLVNAIYSKMLDWNFHSFSWNGVTSIISDDADKGSSPGDTGTDKDQLDNFTFSASSISFNEVWGGQYEAIARANQALDNLPALTINDTLKNRLIGEASFLRAYCYFNLVRSFGGVPLITKVADPTNQNDIQNGRVRATAAQVYTQIESDLATAVNNLPEKSQYNSADLGRATKGAAKALLAKVSMYQKKWNVVQQLTDEIIASGQYSLLPNYGELWRESSENGVESIFEIQGRGVTPNKGVQGYFESQGARGENGWGWGFNTPSQNLFDAYETGDTRRDGTIIRKGMTLWDGRVVSANAENPYYNYKAYVSLTRETNNGSTWETNKNVRILRYGEVLLMNAEAANELGQSTKALTSLNLVRARARGGVTGVLPNVTTTAQADLRQAIWKERRVEMAFEHDRYFDLVRQGRAAAVFQALGKNFVTDKHELFPIPQPQIQLSGGQLTQNPGY